MNKHLEHYIFHKKNFLNEKYCENTIKLLDLQIWKKHDWQKYDGSRYLASKNNSTSLSLWQIINTEIWFQEFIDKNPLRKKPIFKFN